METLPKTNFRGSEKNFQDIKQQLLERFGKNVADTYSAYYDVRSYKGWLDVGRRVRWGERALTSSTIIEVKDQSGRVIRKYPKKIALFHELQTEHVSTLKV